MVSSFVTPLLHCSKWSLFTPPGNPPKITTTSDDVTEPYHINYISGYVSNFDNES